MNSLRLKRRYDDTNENHTTRILNPSKHPAKTSGIEIIDLSNIADSEEGNSRDDEHTAVSPHAKKARFHSPTKSPDHKKTLECPSRDSRASDFWKGSVSGDGDGEKGGGGRDEEEEGERRVVLTEENLGKFTEENSWVFTGKVLSELEFGVLRTLVWVEEITDGNGVFEEVDLVGESIE